MSVSERIDQFIRSYERAIEEFHKGHVYISKKHINKVFAAITVQFSFRRGFGLVKVSREIPTILGKGTMFNSMGACVSLSNYVIRIRS